MKLISALLVSSLSFAPIAATAQKATAAKKPAAHPAAAAASKTGCAVLPPLSPKIPALPAGAPCAKPLYTLTVEPQIKTDFVSPLEGNALKETLGLESTSFSLDYIDTKVGTGAVAAPHQWYTIKYTGYLVDGTKFDSSDDHPGKEPFVFQYGTHQVVAGWDTGFAGMKIGGKRRLFVPFQLAYGPQAHGAIPPKSMLIFDLEFVSQSDTDPSPKPAAAAAPSATAPHAGVGMGGSNAAPQPATAPKPTSSMGGTMTAQPAPAAAAPATPPAATPSKP